MIRTTVALVAGTSLLASTLAMAPCVASPITYSVARYIADPFPEDVPPLNGRVAGTITTDGTLGFLAVANVIDWTLFLDSGIATQTIHGPLSGGGSTLSTFRPNGIFATTTALRYDRVFYGDFSFDGSVNAWLIGPSVDSPDIVAELVGTIDNSGHLHGAPGFNPNVFDFATVAAPAAITEPSAATLFAIGATALGLAARLRRRRAPAVRTTATRASLG